MVAHVLIVVQQQSVLGERLIAPVARGFEFLDTHWKGVLILVVPFIVPVLQELISRVREAPGWKFAGPEVPVERGEKREQSPSGGMS